MREPTPCAGGPRRGRSPAHAAANPTLLASSCTWRSTKRELLAAQLRVEREAARRDHQEHQQRHREASFADHLLDVLRAAHGDDDEQQCQQRGEQQAADEDEQRVGRALLQFERRRALADHAASCAA